MSSALTSPPVFSRSPKFQLLGLVQPLRAVALPAPAPSVPAMQTVVLARLSNASALKPIAIATHAFARPASASAASA
ncbi:uncharacterized protein ARMOST_11082 [Armillaria ostoyae]|uniref:Uncharacterized protein n=1 Tax=Armillaria ostoyae TaxID=47428 RepID=A0A284RG65_ARMOS|nr:uncharacterized protein ARMOST_11082 [Armillaria ostoyae]